MRELTKPLTRCPLRIWKRASASRNSLSKLGLRPEFARKIALDHQMLPDRGNLWGGIARPQRHLVSDRRPAPGLDNGLVFVDRLLQSGNARLAHKRDRHLIVGAIAVVELAPDVLAASLLVGADGPAVGEAVIRVERVGTAGVRRYEHRKADDKKASLHGARLQKLRPPINHVEHHAGSNRLSWSLARW